MKHNDIHPLVRGRYRSITTLVFLVLLGVCAFVSGCGTTVVPPLNPPDPAVVYLCDYGVHSSLILPTSRGNYVEYLYGDWNWAALEHTSWLDALGAIFWSGQACLGRRYVDRAPNQLMPIPDSPPKTETAVIVNAEGCKSLLSQLDSRWEKHRISALLPQPMTSLFWYVKDDEKYSWLHSCNTVTAQSLTAMGCKIKGCAIWSDFKVAGPQ